MSDLRAGGADRLRAEFDDGFAAPRSTANGGAEIVVAIRTAGKPYALRMSQIAGLARDRKIVGIPSPLPELLGLAGVRGELVPVYSLAAWLGHGREATTRWLALAGGGERAGLAFGEIEGQITIAAGDLVASSAGETGEHVRDWLRGEGEIRPIVDVGSILEVISRRCRDTRAAKER